MTDAIKELKRLRNWIFRHHYQKNGCVIPEDVIDQIDARLKALEGKG